ncbi:hypothetical protein NLJ89_g9317 [Agrocybe chaxingu]|uniref:DDE Tnp4 domain-containing protein n=1 Tax=Agrocybe chaxingu TaxID=84603 RepID=A0A9W8JSY7_9AGAR|nr:hypothetical protein NLJ89_g9317 [Agrocybe chaxingu]
MPRRTDRQRRSENLLKTFIQFCKIRGEHVVKRAKRQRRREKKHTQPEPVQPDVRVIPAIGDDTANILEISSISSESSGGINASISDLGSLSGDSDLSRLFATSNSDDTSSGDATLSLTSLSSSFFLTPDFDIPPLLPAGFADSDEEDSDDNSTRQPATSLSYLNFLLSPTPPTTSTVRILPMKTTLPSHMYASRYEQSRTRFPRGPADLPHLLNVLKHECPDHFRQELRVSPFTFDRIVERLAQDPVFFNNSSQAQIPVERQVAITLYRFGHFGNAAGLDKVTKWAGYAKGTVALVTRRVMTAILHRDFMDEAVPWPTPEEKERAKEWVENHSCEGWRDGWCMVDGTLVPLYDRPFWYGESYFDRKCNYSLNIQIVSLPNLHIIDYGYGFTGSAHDSSAWEKTRIYVEHDILLDEDEFIWGDSAYPIQIWVMAPFKKPEGDEPDNKIYNNHVSMVRIRSEHTIGYLKGRFQSLKGLRINIRDEATHKFATYWVVSCIGLHSFAMQCEQREREDSDSSEIDDPFIREGLSSDSESSSDNVLRFPRVAGGRTNRAAALAAGKRHREHLKSLILQARERRRERRERQARRMNVNSHLRRIPRL